MVDQDIVELDDFFYGCLYHFMGHNDVALQFLNPSASSNSLAKLLSDYIQAENTYNSEASLAEKAAQSPTHLQKLSKFQNPLDKSIREKDYFNENNPIFSRRYFQHNCERISEQEAHDVLAAIFYYILRSYCWFWAKKELIGSNIALSKRALNDLVQARELLQDLFWGVKLKDEHGFSLYLNKENEQPLTIDHGTNKISFYSLLFILRVIIDIFKGKVYRQIYFSEKALDNYFRAIRLFEEKIAVSDKLEHNKKFGNFLCSTISKAYFEISKLLFDKGKILDALFYQISSIIHYIILAYVKNSEKSDELEAHFDNAVKAKNILSEIRRSSKEYFRKDMVLSLFINSKKIIELEKIISGGNTNIISPIIVEKEPPLISPKMFETVSGFLADDQKPVISDLMARLGFILYTIREKIQVEKLTEDLLQDKETLENKIDLIKKYNEGILNEIKPYFRGTMGYESELGNYTLTLLGDSSVQFLSKKIERMFSACAIKKFNDDDGNNNIKRICNKLAKHSLINVGNMLSIPIRISDYLAQDGYKTRTSRDFFHRSPLNKLVILRRWQSFNPKVPRPKEQDIRGGGYFLFWNGKGIVIDPGFNFTQNFYEEGFSIEDIDAIVITHTHPDHDDELNTILTLLEEWDQLREKQNLRTSDKKPPKYIDLFLNEGAYRKYNSWLYAKDIKIGKVFFLQSCLWDKRSETSDTGQRENEKNPIINLKNSYNLEIEIVPAWHDELIDKHSSIGLIFHLYENESQSDPALSIGFTGDTENYPKISEMYENVDILVAHLGDIKFRELLSYSDQPNAIIEDFVNSWFTKLEGLTNDDRLSMFIDYVMRQELYGLDPKSIRRGGAMKRKPLKEQYEFLSNCKPTDVNEIKNCFTSYCLPIEGFRYKKHLGLKGLFELHSALLSSGKQKNSEKLMIIGELPEELQAYRHVIACILDEQKPNNKVRCLTGDIGLTVGLPTTGIKYGHPGDESRGKSHPQFAIRCIKCNQNNEYIEGLKGKDKEFTYLPHYHSVDHIQERLLKAFDLRITWFCLEHNAGILDYANHEYFIEPNLRSVWG